MSITMDIDRSGRQLAKRLDLTAVYVMAPEGKMHPVKVGLSRWPDGRRRHVQTANWEAIQLCGSWWVCGWKNAYAAEVETHARLAEHSLSGEWFSARPEIAVATVRDACRSLGVEPIAHDALRGLVASLQKDFEQRWQALIAVGKAHGLGLAYRQYRAQIEVDGEEGIMPWHSWLQKRADNTFVEFALKRIAETTAYAEMIRGAVVVERAA